MMITTIHDFMLKDCERSNGCIVRDAWNQLCFGARVEETSQFTINVPLDSLDNNYNQQFSKHAYF